MGAAAAVATTACAPLDPRVRIGFVVKQPEEPWFQQEWRFAGEAADRLGFRLIRIGAPDGDQVLSAIDTLAAKNAKGFVICAPDPKLGAAIVERSRSDDLKLMTVDDRLIAPDGRPIADVPHVGISAFAIGDLAGRTIAGEARRRGWNLTRDTALLRMSFDSLETGRERTLGGRGALLDAGLPSARVFDAPQRTTDTEGAFNAAGPVLTRAARFRRWAVVGMNDESVLGGVRAAEGLGLAAADVIGVGIGGSGAASAEFRKPRPTGLYASILLSPRRHGYDTAAAMYRWVTQGVKPSLLTYTSGQVMTRDNFVPLLAAQAA